MKKAKDVLKKDWRFREQSPEYLAKEWRTTSYEDWERNLKERLRKGKVITREELFRKEEVFAEQVETSGEDKYRCFSGGYWSVYIDETAKYAAKNNTRDWGIGVKVGEFGMLTGPSLIRKSVLKTLDEETYEEFKQALADDWDSLTECMNKAAEYLEKKKLLGVSFVCSDSSARLLNRLGIRVEGDWAFFFGHYIFEGPAKDL